MDHTKNIDFRFKCPACNRESGQVCKKPTLTEATTGWVKCPECLCDIRIQVTLKNKNTINWVRIGWKQSQRHKDQIQAQRERDKELNREG